MSAFIPVNPESLAFRLPHKNDAGLIEMRIKRLYSFSAET